MEKVKDVQMYPTTKLVGEGAVARLNSILVAPEGSHLDIGGTSTADKTAGFKPKGCTAFGVRTFVNIAKEL